MSDERTNHTAREKLKAVNAVYNSPLTVTQVCEMMGISRVTWYEWEKQLKAAIQPIWGGLSRLYKEN
jgi:transposase-like protein